MSKYYKNQKINLLKWLTNKLIDIDNFLNLLDTIKTSDNPDEIKNSETKLESYKLEYCKINSEISML